MPARTFAAPASYAARCVQHGWSAPYSSPVAERDHACHTTDRCLARCMALARWMATDNNSGRHGWRLTSNSRPRSRRTASPSAPIAPVCPPSDALIQIVVWCYRLRTRWRRRPSAPPVTWKRGPRGTIAATIAVGSPAELAHQQPHRRGTRRSGLATAIPEATATEEQQQQNDDDYQRRRGHAALLSDHAGVNTCRTAGIIAYLKGERQSLAT